jgi:hypothetical protein
MAPIKKKTKPVPIKKKTKPVPIKKKTKSAPIKKKVAEHKLLQARAAKLYETREYDALMSCMASCFFAKTFRDNMGDTVMEFEEALREPDEPELCKDTLVDIFMFLLATP